MKPGLGVREGPETCISEDESSEKEHRRGKNYSNHSILMLETKVEQKSEGAWAINNTRTGAGLGRDGCCVVSTTWGHAGQGGV